MTLAAASLSPPVTIARADRLPIRAGASVPRDEFARVRTKLLLECCKWDPQVGDVSTLADFPLLLAQSTWRFLAESAEVLARETLEMERCLLERPDLHPKLGVPRRLRRVLRDAATAPTPPAARVMRFDFHFTTEGWRISEVNSDVPGGFTEASAFAGAMAELADGATAAAGDPAATLADALVRAARAEDDGAVALVSAPGFMEDHQVVANLARLVRERGVDAHLAQPRHLRWIDRRAHLDAAWRRGPVVAIVRFYQAEWLAGLRRDQPRWSPLFAGGRTPVCNPGVSVLSESKRVPLLWDDLGVAAPTWRRLLPETRDVRDVRWRRDESWLIKTAYCNTGDSVTARDLVPSKRWCLAKLDALLHPRQWLAQKRFDPIAIDTPHGEMFACVGVYTIDGRACGIYGRLSPRPVINYEAIDVAVLIAQEGRE